MYMAKSFGNFIFLNDCTCILWKMWEWSLMKFNEVLFGIVTYDIMAIIRYLSN